MDINFSKKSLDGMSREELLNIKNYLDDLYYNTDNPAVSDEIYDLLIDEINKKNPSINKVGCTPRPTQFIVKLPYYLPSIQKIKNDDNPNPNGGRDFVTERSSKFSNWLNNNTSFDYIITDKLDGVSCLLEIKHNTVKMYTRGDGTYGTDISHLFEYIKWSPLTETIQNNSEKGIFVRGELIIPVSVFKKKYSQDFKNPRNMVSGIVNSKTIPESAYDLRFIAYELIQDGTSLPQSEQLNTLHIRLGFDIVEYTIKKHSALNLTSLVDLFLDRKNKSIYEIDGIIIQPNISYRRNNSINNPDYAFAFKMNINKIETIVKNVIWNISKWGIAKPIIEFNSIEIGGVTISYTTGFNASYIKKYKIGPGSVIKITRSGDVIPYITDILSDSTSGQPSMPDFEYKWNKSNKDIIALNKGNDMCIKFIYSFFMNIGVKYLGEETVKKLYNSGYTSVIKILNATIDDFKKLDGFKKTLAIKIYNNIHNTIIKSYIPDILSASGIFGFGMGKKKINQLFKEIPDLFTYYKLHSNTELFDRIITIDGFSSISASKISIKNIKNSEDFINILNNILNIKLKNNKKFDNETKPDLVSLSNFLIVFTGFRNIELEQKILDKGGKVTSTVSKKTTCVIAKNIEDNSRSIIKAKLFNIPIYSEENFCNIYHI